VNAFPKATLSQHIGVLGKTGSGKTYFVRGVVEGLLDDNARVCIIDPTGAWSGLRSSATGKSAGYLPLGI
jgi:DNA helicase HerA-like ATPase